MAREIKTEVGVLIAIPTIGRPLVMEWALALKSMNPPINFNAQTMVIHGREVGDARNEFAQAAINKGAKYLFFLGDDVEPPPFALTQLIFRMEHDPTLGVVGGIYCSKSDSKPNPLVFRGNGSGSYWKWKLGEYFEVTGLGMDCTLIRTDILKEIEGPWFKTIRRDQFLDAINNAEHWTEDLFFLKRVYEETDHRIFADASVICRHWDPGPPKKFYTLPPDSYPMQGEPLKKGKKILDLGSGGVDHGELKKEGNVTTVDLRDDTNPDYRCDVRNLPFDNGVFDLVSSSHVLEHFGRDEVDSVLDEWLRVLKPGGELRTIVPSIEWAAKKIVDGEVSWDVKNVLYGLEDYDLNFHKNGFTLATLTELLESKGLKILSRTEIGYNIIIQAQKAKRKRKAKKKDGISTS